MTEVKAVSEMSACFDGNIYIYIIGGLDENRDELNTVYRFDTYSEHFEELAAIQLGYVSNVSTFFHNGSNSIIIINDMGDALSYDVVTQDTCSLFSFNEYIGEVNTSHISCYDGHDNIYIMANEDGRFVKFSMILKQFTKLTGSPFEAKEDIYRLIYDQSFGITLIAGKGQNYRYSTQRNDWTLLNDNDPVGLRKLLGACLIRD
ncbi:hypothetical protein SAMD00019534_088000 [Acytostelium subglobosum LB1]|uniref:hypothetical protein n=1 Tax=Acytostelium subglobosum LB1 TaxID=1410327 RepID=UPI0006449051|nr:hypothetical protein SAMD00019534_088000 [Acytostelium subglobosum LB1]GAM25625.1 hypothetical protein SAMD00019534_088000 [Acytostelium subglobosum LB1]|eukprot:XP_012751611.1 hypothetical protein SAMD00019534_088000 [Acytostelium subglobosum LB1]